MKIISKIPGPILIFMGACSLSFGGLIVKSFEGSTLWQILFWRSVFFVLTVLTFLIITYKKKLFSAFYKSGLPGFFGGIILSIGFLSQKRLENGLKKFRQLPCPIISKITLMIKTISCV